MQVSDNELQLVRTLQTIHVQWPECWYIVPRRFPAHDPFSRISDSGDIYIVQQIEALSNQNVREEQGRIRVLPRQDHITGPYHPIVLAAFTLGGCNNSRFSSDQQGVLYTTQQLSCSIREVQSTLEDFLAATEQAPIEVDLCAYKLGLDADLYDLRQIQAEHPELYDTDDFQHTQELAQKLRSQGAYGVLYHSHGEIQYECAAIFRPQAITQCYAQQHLCFVWDGTKITDIYEKRQLGLVAS